MRRSYTEIVQRLHQRGIAVQGTFVFGFDAHTPDTFAETVEFVIDARIDLPRYAILTPFPGTPLFKKLKEAGRILTEDWMLYDGQHVVYRPLQMSPKVLLDQTEWAWKQSYSYRSIAKRLLGSRIMLPLSLAANFGYRFYAYHLHDFYNCDWVLGHPAAHPAQG